MARSRKYATEEEAKAARKASKKASDARRYQAKKEQILAKQADYYQENREVILAKSADYYQENRDKILAQKAEYYQENKEAEKAKSADYRQTLFGMCASKSGSYRAIDRKRFGTDEGSVTTEQMQEMIELHPYCFYCGCEDITQLGLDRIDNSKPHTVDNCVVCCQHCNAQRSDIPFKEYCKIKGITI